MSAVAWVVTIGDELLRGEIVDSNKSFLSERLLQLELETERHITVADDPPAITEVLSSAAARARVVLVSGGLGPTRDGLTTQVAADTFGRKLVRDPAALAELEAFFRSVGREMAANNAKQADFPEGAEVLPNPLGTAPGFMLEHAGCQLFFMPGVPRELYRMVDEEVLPRIRAALGQEGVVRAQLLRTFGIGESNLDRELADLTRGVPGASLGFRTQFPDNLVRVVVRGRDQAEAEQRLRELVDQIRARLGGLLVGDDERALEFHVGERLLARGVTLAVAESCTGGLLSSRLTDVPGSSGYLLESFVTYSDAAKQRELGVSAADLAQHGPVSEPVARQMAEGARARAGAELGIATTGRLGPDAAGSGPGHRDAEAGTLFVALADGQGTVARHYPLMRDRARNKQLATQIALDWIRRRLDGLEVTTELFPRLRGAPGSGSGGAA